MWQVRLPVHEYVMNGIGQQLTNAMLKMLQHTIAIATFILLLSNQVEQ